MNTTNTTNTMNAMNANVAAVTADFQIDKHQSINLSATKVQNEAIEKPNDTSSVSFSKEEIKGMTAALNEYTENLNTNFGFVIREELNDQIVVEIKDKDTDETIKQFPPEELLQIKEKMAELIGLIFEVRV